MLLNAETICNNDLTRNAHALSDLQYMNDEPKIDTKNPKIRSLHCEHFER